MKPRALRSRPLCPHPRARPRGTLLAADVAARGHARAARTHRTAPRRAGPASTVPSCQRAPGQRRATLPRSWPRRAPRARTPTCPGRGRRSHPSTRRLPEPAREAATARFSSPALRAAFPSPSRQRSADPGARSPSSRPPDEERPEKLGSAAPAVRVRKYRVGRLGRPPRAGPQTQPRVSDFIGGPGAAPPLPCGAIPAPSPRAAAAAPAPRGSEAPGAAHRCCPVLRRGAPLPPHAAAS